MSLHSVERYPFDRIFTVYEPQGGQTVADSMLELAALRAELNAVRSAQESALAAARIDGFEAGLMQARGERDAALLSAVDALHGAIEELDERYDETVRRLTGDAAELALDAADMIAGHAVERAPTAGIDEAIGRVLNQVARGTELQIRVHPTLVETVEECVAARQRNDRRKLNLAVLPDGTLPPGDALIAWEQGGLTLDAAARRAAVVAELEALMPAAPLVAAA